MTIRALIIDSNAKAGATRVLEYSTRPENLYIPGAKSKVPGDDPGHVLQLGDYRIVFSLTKDPELGVFKHLSISVPDPNRFPNPLVVEEVISLFSFVGGLKNSMVDVNKKEGCIVVAQPLSQVLN
jgi:hypothetical protein